MDDRGNIRHFSSDEEAKKAGYKTALTPKEYQALLGHPEEDRPVELALLRYCEKRKELGRTVSLHEKQAFRMGWFAAQEKR